MANTVLANLAAALSGKLVSTTGELSVSVTLNNGQILTLPTTPVTIVPAPGVGYRTKITGISVISDCTAGNYGNINTTYADLSLALTGGTDKVYPIAFNDGGLTPPATQVTAMLASAGTLISDVPPYDLMATGDPVPDLAYVISRGRATIAAHNNSLLKLVMGNNGSGNLTGGNVANYLKITVYYRLELLP